MKRATKAQRQAMTIKLSEISQEIEQAKVTLNYCKKNKVEKVIQEAALLDLELLYRSKSLLEESIKNNVSPAHP